MRGSRILPPILCLWASLGPGAPSADILHLKDGRKIQVEDWWETESEYFYSRFGGTVAISKDSVSRIERTRKRGPEGPAFPSRPPGTPKPDPPPLPDPPFGEPGGTRRGGDLPGEFLRIWQEARDKGEWDEAIRFYDEAWRRDPGNLQAAVFRVASYLASESYRLALSAADEAMWRHGEDPSLLYLVGEIHYREDRLPQALHCWEEALERRERPHLRRKVEKLRREMATEGSYEELWGDRFRLRYQGEEGCSKDLAREVVAYLEDRIGDLSIRLDHFPPAAISVILYPDQEFRDATLSPREVQGLFDGKIRVPVGGLTRISEGLRRLLNHELVHAIVDSKTAGNCPSWIQEGLAQYLSGDSSRPFRRTLAREFNRLHGSEGWHPGLSYPAALSCVEYLVAQNGFTAWLAILERLGEGKGFEKALEETLRMGPRELFQQWGESLQEEAPRSR